LTGGTSSRRACAVAAAAIAVVAGTAGTARAAWVAQLTAFPAPRSGTAVQGITRGPDGNVWFTEYSGQRIGRVTPDGAITEFPIGRPSYGRGAEDIVAGPDGNLWFAEIEGDSIGRITPGGTVTEFATPTNGSAPVGDRRRPRRQPLFTEAYGNKIGRITPSGEITEYPVPTAQSHPDQIVAGPDGNLWFTEPGFDITAGHESKIGQITPTGTVTETPALCSSIPNEITTGADGNLWITDDIGNAIDRVSVLAQAGPDGYGVAARDAPTLANCAG
jgi:virginiamycin B lyase